MNYKSIARRLAKIEAQLGGAEDGTIMIRAGMKGLHDALALLKERQERRDRPAGAPLREPRNGMAGLLADVRRTQRFMAERDQATLLASANRPAETAERLSDDGAPPIIVAADEKNSPAPAPAPAIDVQSERSTP